MEKSAPNKKRRPPVQRVFIVLARLVLLFVLLLFLSVPVVRIFSDRLIFHPVKEEYADPTRYGPAYEERWLTTAGGDSVRAWRIPWPEGPGGRPVLLFFQGNAGNISLMADRLAAFHFLGFECYSVDYPGYGPSPGRPSEAKVYQSAEALWDWAVENGAEAENSVFYGFSLGGGVASYLAAEKNPAALVLDSTFTKLRDVPGRMLPFLGPYFYLTLGQAFDTNRRLREELSCPLVVLHSPDDDVVPYSLGLANYEDYAHPKEMVTGQGDHMDFLMNLKAYQAPLEKIGERITKENVKKKGPERNDISPKLGRSDILP